MSDLLKIRHEDQCIEWLQAVIDIGADDDHAAVPRSVRTFEEAGLLTMNKGLVIRFETGAVFQVQVLQSERPFSRDDEEDEDEDDGEEEYCGVCEEALDTHGECQNPRCPAGPGGE